MVLLRHMISPLDLEWDELLVYHQLYLRSDFTTGITEYTDRQIEESLRKAKVGRKRIRTILKKFVDGGLFIEISEGVRGKNSKPAVGKIVKMKDILGTLIEPNTNLKGTLKTIENTTTYEDNEPNTNLKGILIDPLIKETKNKEEIYIDIFDFWNSKSGVDHKELKTPMINAINKALKKYKSVGVIKQAINNYDEILKSNYYYSHKFTLEKFLKQSNGISEFLEEGSVYENYLEFKKQKQQIQEQPKGKYDEYGFEIID